jgi:hypothetical protein
MSVMVRARRYSVSGLNGAAGGRNPLAVRDPKQLLAAALGVGLLVGCGGAPGPAAGGDLAGEPGMTAVRVVNHVAPPGALDRLTITIDNEPVALGSVPPLGAPPATVARLHLRPGPHSIGVRAKARAPGSEVLVVGAQQPFSVGAAAATITVDVRSGAGGPDDARDAAPIAVSLAIQGGRMAPDFGVAPSDDKDERCAGLLPVPRAICRAAVDLDEATRKNDVVAAFCVRDKLAEMRRLALVSESGRGDAVAMAEAEVAELSRRVELCSGSSAAPRPDGVTVTPPPRAY